MKLIEKLFLILAYALGGYLLYQMYLSVKAGAKKSSDSIAGTMASWMPSALGKDLFGGVNTLWTDLSTPAPNTATPAGLPAAADNLTGNYVSSSASSLGSYFSGVNSDNTVTLLTPAERAAAAAAADNQAAIDANQSALEYAGYATAMPFLL